MLTVRPAIRTVVGAGSGITSSPTWAGVSAGFDTACAARTDGSLWCWGNNTTGQLADGTTTHRYAPTRIATATTWTNNAAVGYHNCVSRTDSTLWCWGNNANAQLGDGTTTQRSAPLQVTLPA